MAAAVASRPQTQTTAQPKGISHNAPIPRYIQPAETKSQLDWADLKALDLSIYDQPNGKKILTEQLNDAIKNVGFFYIVNYGLTQEQVDRQFAIGKAYFELPDEEKIKYRSARELGKYNGYKPRGEYHIKDGVYDNIEIYNMGKKFDQTREPQAELLQEHWDEITGFGNHVQEQIVKKLLTLFALVMELPEDYFIERCRQEDESDCHLRYMKYTHRTPEMNAKLEGLYTGGHTDFGICTLLWRQPIAALQVRDSEGSWKWVKPHAGSITVNIADSLQFMSGGYLKSSIHRVAAPPADQEHLDRIGLLYFVRPTDDVELLPVKSPLLDRLGIKPEPVQTKDGKPLLAGEWVKARVAHNFKSRSTDAMRLKSNDETEILNGVKTKYYA